MLKLYTYFRSTAAYRVRLALNLKKLHFEAIPVHLLRDGGEQKSAQYLSKNPTGLVPTLELSSEETDPKYLSQSIAILEYLEESHPEPALLPQDPLGRARVRSISQTIACDIHPLNNLRVLQYLTGDMGLAEDQKLEWYKHWIATGFTAIERILQDDATGLFCHGDQPSFADCCLIPQVYNAERFACPMDDYPAIRRINAHCKELEAFINADPATQADAE